MDTWNCEACEKERQRKTRRATGRVGRFVYIVLCRDGVSQFVGLAKWEADYMMRENNGKDRGWSVVRFVREAS